MNRLPTDHVREGEGLVIDFFGHTFDFRRSDDKYCLMIDIVPPGQGVPLHTHANMDEGFYVLAGDFRFALGDSTLDAAPGDYLYAVRTTPHGFRCVSEGAGKLLCVSTPGGFEKFCQAVLDEIGEGDFDRDKFAEIAARFDTEFIGPMPE